MKYLNKILFVLFFFCYSLKTVCQEQVTNPYKIDFYNGYVVDLFFIKSEHYTILLSVMVDNLNFAKDCNNLTVNETINWFVNNSFVFPLQCFSEYTMFEQICGKLNKELLTKILKYQVNYTKQLDFYSKEGKVILKDGYTLSYVYSKYSGIIFVPLKGNELYNDNCAESIDFKEYPNIKIAMPIYSGYIAE